MAKKIQKPVVEEKEVVENQSFLHGFLDFVKEQGVIGLAIAFILGGAVTKVVSSLVSDIINPILGIALSAADNLDNATVTVASAEIRWGSFLSVLIDFVVIASVVYALAHLFHLDKVIKKK